MAGSIFDDIRRGDLEAVQQRVLANGAVLEEWGSNSLPLLTPLMYATFRCKTAIALWLIEHRGDHDVNTTTDDGWTALHWASINGPLEVVQALVAAGANPAATTASAVTPLVYASCTSDIVSFLLQLPAAKATIDHITLDQHTALSLASLQGHQPIVQLLLDAGADPTIPAGQHSPLTQAIVNYHDATVALLRHAIAEVDRVRMRVALVGTRKGLCKELYLKPLEYLLPAWAAKDTAGL